MAGRKILDREDAAKCLEAAGRSGLGRSEWARANGVDGRSLNAWRVSMERASRKSQVRDQKVHLVELVPTLAEPKPDTRYVVRCGVLAVEVDAYFDDFTLARLLRVVTSC